MKDLDKFQIYHCHQPLCFLSAEFFRQQLGWSDPEKEADAFMATVERMHWLLATSAGFGLFTDNHHSNFLFDPLAAVSDLTQTSSLKVLRWDVRMSAYNYSGVHIRRVDNVLGYLLSRWSF